MLCFALQGLCIFSPADPWRWIQTSPLLSVSSPLSPCLFLSGDQPVLAAQTHLDIVYLSPEVDAWCFAFPPSPPPQFDLSPSSHSHAWVIPIRRGFLSMDDALASLFSLSLWRFSSRVVDVI